MDAVALWFISESHKNHFLRTAKLIKTFCSIPLLSNKWKMGLLVQLTSHSIQWKEKGWSKDFRISLFSWPFLHFFMIIVHFSLVPLQFCKAGIKKKHHEGEPFWFSPSTGQRPQYHHHNHNQSMRGFPSFYLYDVYDISNREVGHIL